MATAYTYMSSDGVLALIQAIKAQAETGEKLQLELNYADSVAFVRALQFTYRHEAGDVSYWAGDFLSNLASTYDVEWI